MKKLIILLFIVSTMCMVMPSCGPSEKEIREKIEKERQDSIKAEEAKAEALRLEEEKKREEEERRKEERRKWEASEEGKGWAFIRARLKSPSTASLVGYAETDAPPCRELANKINLPGLGVAMYEVDAQNGFGAMIRTQYLLFFKYGEPIYVEEAESLASAPPTRIKTLLQVNGY